MPRSHTSACVPGGWWLLVPAMASRDGDFASYLQLRKDPNLHPPVVMHVSLLQRHTCRHCKRREDLRRLSPATPATTPPGSDGRERVVSLPDADDEEAPEAAAAATTNLRELALEGRSCFQCAEEVCRETRYLRDAVPACGGGDTPVHHAVRSGNLRLLCHLLTLVGEEGGHGRAVEVLRKQNDREETALYAAFGAGDIAIVKLLLWVDPAVGEIPWPAASPPPMYLAVSMGRMDIAEALHRTGASLSYSGPKGQNALHAALLFSGGMTYKLLSWNNALVTQKDENGSTPLHFAASLHFPGNRTRQKRVSTVSQLLHADSFVAYEPNNEGLYPVHIAAMKNRCIALDVLLTRCPGCMGLRDNKGRTFLHVAVQNKATTVVRYACDREVKFASIMNIQDKDGNTALHLAVEARHLGMVSALLKNQGVCLNLMNNKYQTARDIAKSKIRQGFYFTWNPDKLIFRLLRLVWASPSCCVKDIKEVTSDVGDVGEKEESEKLTSSTQVLGIGSVLVATVTFGATFTVPGGNIADDHTNGGTPTLAARWYFDAFMVANTLAFICSSVATACLMYAGMAMVSLPSRRRHFNRSWFFVSSSVTCLTTAFALGVYLLLAPVARPTAIAICSISPLVLLYKDLEFLRMAALCSVPLRRRRGFWVWLKMVVSFISKGILVDFWPFAIIFGWAGYLRDRRHG
ncbi:hypothetical protein ACP4OV_006860 [Aristida adscensionis]